MINEKYGWYECGCGERFQDLVETEIVFNEETGQEEQLYYWDEQTSGERMWAHWYAVHEEG